VLDTSCGQFTIALDVKNAPKTSASFVHLARRGFFDGTTFHRVVPNFVIQGGDPEGTGQGGPGYEVVEPPPPGTRYTKGVVAMAKTEIDDPGTSGSQFYVVTGEDAQLPAEYAVLGRVSAGQDVVDLIGALPTDQANPDPSKRESPVDPVVIRAVRIDERRG
jgi:cyclophilin family peptidyl-prolyl cis-trans isomerase